MGGIEDFEREDFVSYSLRPKLYIDFEKKIVSNYKSFYNTNATLMLLFLL